MELYQKFLECGAVTTDSRNCPEGSMFFALKGASFDGNQYALSALEKGCRYAVVDDTKVAVDDRFILVEDVLKALQELAAWHRKTLGTTIIGITGSNGKTTTKELVSAVLSKKGNVLYTQGNLNNHIGVPLTLLRLTPQHKMAVIEMGANHPGEIAALVNIAQPDYGLITNVGRVHLEGFGSFEGVKKTKGELYDYLRSHGGMAFLLTDSADLTEMASGLRTIGYGSTDCETNYVSGALTSEATSPFISVRVKCFDQSAEIKTHLIGTYNLPNVLAAVCVGRFFDVPLTDVKSAIEAYSPTNSRSQLVKTASNTLIVDAYNANPTSMAAAISNFAQLDMPCKMCILGDMGEIGAESINEHKKIVALLKENGLDNVYFVGKTFREASTGYKYFENVNILKEFLASNPLKNVTILIKGSNSNHLSTLVDAL